VSSRLTRVEVEGIPILVGRLIGGDVVAVTPVCPHHQYTYDARTGENRYPKNVFPEDRKAGVNNIGTYSARDDGEWVWVRL